MSDQVPVPEITDEDRMAIEKGFDTLMRIAHQNAQHKGFWDKERNVGEQIALVHSELSEALEADRTGNGPSDKIPEFSGVEEEYSDAVIRLSDMSAGGKHRLGKAIIAKLEYNLTRSRMHGKKF